MKTDEQLFFINPPWIEYASSKFEGPFWGGWRQGNAEPWFRDIWTPFWKKLTPEERIMYLEKNPLPEPHKDDWDFALKLWSGEINLRVKS